MNLGLVVPGFDEEVAALLLGDGVEDLGDSIADGVLSLLGGFLQQVLEFGEEHLDRVQVGRVFRQEEEYGRCAQGVTAISLGASHFRGQ